MPSKDKMDYGDYCRMMEVVNSMDYEARADLLNEILFELASSRWDSAEDRIGGIHEVITSICKIDV